MPEELKQIISAVIRKALTGVSTWLVLNGWLSQEQSDWLLAGIAGIVVALIWSIYNKLRTQKLIDQALQMPAGSTREALRDSLQGD